MASFAKHRIICFIESFALLSHDEPNNSPYHLIDVHCNGTENMLSDCGHRRKIGYHECGTTEHAGVICTS